MRENVRAIIQQGGPVYLRRISDRQPCAGKIVIVVHSAGSRDTVKPGAGKGNPLLEAVRFTNLK